MRTTRRLRGAVVGLVGAALMLSGCGGSGSTGAAPVRSLEAVLLSIANLQHVDLAIVRKSVVKEAATSGDKKALALRWEKAVPKRALPELSAEVKSGACEAVIDVLDTHQVPSGEEFWTEYLSPGPRVGKIMEEFDALHAKMESGTLTEVDVQFTMMKFLYCG